MKELTSVILCHRRYAKPVSSAKANTEQQAQLVFRSARPRGRWNIAPLPCTVGLCLCQPWLSPLSCCSDSGPVWEFSLCRAQDTQRDHDADTESLQSTSGSFMARRGLHMYLHRQFIQFLLELILYSLSFPMNLPYKGQEKVCETVTSETQRECPASTRLTCWRPALTAVAKVTKFHSRHWHRTRPNPFPTPQQDHFSLAIALPSPVCGSHFLGVPEAGKCPEQRSCSHAHCKAHHETHLYSVKAAGLRLPIRAHGHRHLKKKRQYPHRFTALSNRLL